MDNFEKFENQLLSSYDTALSIKGRELCEEIDFLISDEEEFLFEKILVYCNYCLKSKRNCISKNLIDRCKKYFDDLRNFRDIKNTLENISKSRKKV